MNEQTENDDGSTFLPTLALRTAPATFSLGIVLTPASREVAVVRAERDDVVAGFGMPDAVGSLRGDTLDLPLDLREPGVHSEVVDGRPRGTHARR